MILPTRIFDELAGLGRRMKQFPVEALLKESTIERFDGSVLPKAAGVNAERLNTFVSIPARRLISTNSEPLSLRNHVIHQDARQMVWKRASPPCVALGKPNKPAEGYK